MFRTPLHVAHLDHKDWKLTRPLVYEGGWEYVIIMPGFVTDFASIPKPVRWLLDNAGRNAEAAVLHDAVWRESRRTDTEPRVDPYHADGLFRRALRETGSTTLARGLMWFAVRVAAMVRGRVGALGPSLPVKLLQLAVILVIGALTALIPTAVAVIGLVVYWVGSWIVGVVWFLVYERRRFGGTTNWPWPANDRRRVRPGDDLERELLVLVPKGADAARPEPEALHLEGLLARDGALDAADILALTAARSAPAGGDAGE